MQEMLQRMQEMWREEIKKTKALSNNLFLGFDKPVNDEARKEVDQVVSGRLWFLDHSGVWFNDAFIIRKGILRGVDEYDDLPAFVQQALELDVNPEAKMKPCVYIALEEVKACLDGSFSGVFYGQGHRQEVPGINIVEHDGTVHRFAVETEEEQDQWITSIGRLTHHSRSSSSSDLSSDEPPTNGMRYPPVNPTPPRRKSVEELELENESLRCALMAALDRMKIFSATPPTDQVRIGIDVKLQEGEGCGGSAMEARVRSLQSDVSELQCKVGQQQEEILELSSELQRCREGQEELGLLLDATEERVTAVHMLMSNVASMWGVRASRGGDIESNYECLQRREDQLLQIVSQLESFVAVCSQSMGAAEESTAAVERTLQVVSERVMEKEAEERWEVERIELLSEDCKKFLGDVQTDGLLKEVEEMAERRQRAHEDWGERRKEAMCHDDDDQLTDGGEEPDPPLRAIESCEVEACGWREQVQKSVKGLGEEISELGADFQRVVLKQRSSISRLTDGIRRIKEEEGRRVSALRALEEQTSCLLAGGEEHRTQVEGMSDAVNAMEGVMERLVKDVTGLLLERKEEQKRRSAAHRSSAWLESAAGASGSPESSERKRPMLDFSPVERNSWASNTSIGSDTSLPASARSRSRYTFL
ncbi:hypothetical protein GUITHDRAFT_149323 [Guillardia theta CCMP2712]|uniref:PH domain-containing protein n=1 Tax=Guillardia theta (strain CCMP2712) TaxID=905079 RepID=L1I559_GUITC|nr:hypothetical protein GUITHDRAFT_149323 [Guillardia theta CCMP2712]EKX31398.1 hypothetical protein GUITHDRAFT_149323 [Guillardia theta CCMP2712]|eukprot:XP_005818378.1 hypothetical protein GUITHDRAFT_149323 [Guillardia theta CCMP2712]